MTTDAQFSNTSTSETSGEPSSRVNPVRVVAVAGAILAAMFGVLYKINGPLWQFQANGELDHLKRIAMVHYGAVADEVERGLTVNFQRTLAHIVEMTDPLGRNCEFIETPSDRLNQFKVTALGKIGSRTLDGENVCSRTISLHPLSRAGEYVLEKGDAHLFNWVTATTLPYVPADGDDYQSKSDWVLTIRERNVSPEFAYRYLESRVMSKPDDFEGCPMQADQALTALRNAPTTRAGYLAAAGALAQAYTACGAVRELARRDQAFSTLEALSAGARSR